MMLEKIGTLALAAAAVVSCKQKDGDAAKGGDSDLPEEIAKWMPPDAQSTVVCRCTIVIALSKHVTRLFLSCTPPPTPHHRSRRPGFECCACE
jgi:hypothetical protein